MIDADPVERELIARLRAAKLRLRFDKVALRVVGELKRELAKVVPPGETVVFTITAPIKHPAKTVVTLEKIVGWDPLHAERREIVHGNEVRIRRLKGVPQNTPRALGFVYSAESSPGPILT